MTNLRQFSSSPNREVNQILPQTQRQLKTVTFSTQCILLPCSSRSLGVVMHGLDLCRENGEYHTRRPMQLLDSVVIAKDSSSMMQVCGLESQVSIAFPVPIILQEHDV